MTTPGAPRPPSKAGVHYDFPTISRGLGSCDTDHSSAHLLGGAVFQPFDRVAGGPNG
jgi:hypothetical protein